MKSTIEHITEIENRFRKTIAVPQLLHKPGDHLVIVNELRDHLSATGRLRLHLRKQDLLFCLKMADQVTLVET